MFELDCIYNKDRHYVGFEINKGYYQTAKARIADAMLIDS